MGFRTNIARQVAASKATGAGGNYINPGKGVLIVSAMKEGTKPEFFKGDTAVCEFVVESCTGFTGHKDKDGKEKPAGNQPGSVCTYLEPFQGQWADLARGRFKGFLMSLYGETAESLAQGAALVAQGVKDGKPLPGAFGEYAHAIAKDEIPKGTTWDADAQFAAMYDYCTNRGLNPARGMRIAYNTIEKETGDGEFITVPKWETIAQTDAEVAKVRAELGRTIPTPPAPAGGAPAAA